MFAKIATHISNKIAFQTVGCIQPAGKPYMFQFQLPPPDATPEEEVVEEGRQND